MASPTDPATLVLDIIDLGDALEQRLDGALGTIKGISFSEYRILQSIADSPGRAASRVELAAAVRLSPSGVTRALKPLEKLGFVETVRDERDARQAKATLTPEGDDLVADARGVVGDTIETLLETVRAETTDIEVAQRTIRALRP